MSNGFYQDQLNDAVGIDTAPILVNKTLIIRCFHEPSKFQVGALNREQFDGMFRDATVAQEKAAALWQLHESTVFTADELTAKLTEACPEAAKVFDVYEKAGFAGMTLTSVGIAIGHANARRVSGFDADLAIWIK